MAKRSGRNRVEMLGPDDASPLAEVEADHIRRVLASVRDNKTRAAEILGIDRKTLREKLARAEDDAARPETPRPP